MVSKRIDVMTHKYGMRTEAGRTKGNLRLGARQDRFLRCLSKRYQSLSDMMRHSSLSYKNDGYVVRSLHKQGLIIVSDDKIVGNRIVKITAEGQRRRDMARDMIISQDLTDKMPKYFGMRQRQVLRLFRRTPVLTARSIASRLGLDRRDVEGMLAKMFHYQFITNIDDMKFVLIKRGLRWLDDDCEKRGIKRYPTVEE